MIGRSTVTFGLCSGRQVVVILRGSDDTNDPARHCSIAWSDKLSTPSRTYDIIIESSRSFGLSVLSDVADDTSGLSCRVSAQMP
jgi:hypothetical protein